jgi:hypothetical protein
MVLVHARNAPVLLAAAFLGLDFSKNLASKTAEPIEKGALYLWNPVKWEFPNTPALYTCLGTSVHEYFLGRVQGVARVPALVGVRSSDVAHFRNGCTADLSGNHQGQLRRNSASQIGSLLR